MQPPNTFGAGELDRAALLRTSREQMADLLAASSTRWVLTWRNKNLVLLHEEPQAHLVSEPPRELSDQMERAVFLGQEKELSYFALDISDREDPVGELQLEGKFVDLRSVGGVLTDADAALLAYARAISFWHRSHRFCGSCGAPTQRQQAGHQRRCTNPACSREHFPRTDPAVIMLVEHNDLCLLGRQATWPEGIFSTLAGFVEPGESLEAAVAREVFEESGVRVGRVTYHSSQPWPFPCSIMLGFLAEATTTEIFVNQSELEQAHWFSREQIWDLKARRELRLPNRFSIARRLVEHWLHRE